VSDGRGGRKTAAASPLQLSVCGLDFQNPVLLASGTAAYGREISQVTDIDALGGLVTKAVSLEPRDGAAPPRVAEFPGGMLNAIGLANPGVAAVRETHLPWLATNLRRCRVIVNVVGYEAAHFAHVVEQLDSSPGVHAFELNMSCPNVTAGGLEFGADPATLASAVTMARRVTRKPLLVKLSPVLSDISVAAKSAEGAGADALTLVNTIPGMLVDVQRRRPVLGFGSGGVSGAVLLPVGVLATWRVHNAVRIPLVGVGGIATAEDALQYMIAGASLVAIGTASLRDPRAAERVVRGMSDWCEREGVSTIESIIGTLEWTRQ
jgi:dihydroorotate dehydrogenase (NAD+) catalytic subunit